MNWARIRRFPWIDTRAAFVARVPNGGALLDVGSSDGCTLGHIAELRPDLVLHAADRAGSPDRYPPGCRYHQLDFEKDKFQLSAGSIHAVTCLHVVEHIRDLPVMLAELHRVLKPGASAYFETPAPKSLVMPSAPGDAAGRFPMNFYDDLTHVRFVSIGALASHAREAGFQVQRTGISRNWAFVAAYPFFLFMPDSPQKFTARLHWHGWSAFLVARKAA
jgi:SAM-dependent methyltransferase